MATPRAGVLVSLVVLLVTGCGSGRSVPPPVPVRAKLLIIRSYGSDFPYCDPDVWPVGDASPALDHARQALPEMRKRPRVWHALLRIAAVPADRQPSDSQLVTMYQDWKKLPFIVLHPDGDHYRFRVYLEEERRQDTGTISSSGAVSVESRVVDPNAYGCPICLVRGVMIATLDGPVPVEDVRVGMLVWTVDRAGHRVSAPVVRTRHLTAAGEVLRVTLADGRTVVVSPGHPTVDGRPIGELRPGDLLSGSTIRAISPVPYRGLTYDLLPSGPTGTYFADGVLLGSTLRDQ